MELKELVELMRLSVAALLWSYRQLCCLDECRSGRGVSSSETKSKR